MWRLLDAEDVFNEQSLPSGSHSALRCRHEADGGDVPAQALDRDRRPGGESDIRVRASQINGCAFCIDMHCKDARAAGESAERLYSLDAWRESPLYEEREGAALELCEAMTLVAD